MKAKPFIPYIGAVLVIAIVLVLALRNSPTQEGGTASETSEQEQLLEGEGMLMAEVERHRTTEDCYTAISGKVYNLTSWVNQHPGGAAAVLSLCGTDGTTAFMQQHGDNPAATERLQGFFIGTVIAYAKD